LGEVALRTFGIESCKDVEIVETNIVSPQQIIPSHRDSRKVEAVGRYREAFASARPQFNSGPPLA
jgi:hypothetical protein